jgi:hypothetical protein
MKVPIEKYLVEQASLATTRDALLPELLSGEIRVKDAEKFINEKVIHE